MRLVALALAQREVGAGAVLGGDGAQPESPDVVSSRQRCGLHDLAPRENRVAGKQRRDMPAAVDRRDVEGVGEAVETQRARERNDVPAVDEPPAEPPLSLAELVEMNFGGVLVEPGRHLVLGFLDGDAVDMVDSFALSVVLEPIGRTAEGLVERGAIDARAGWPRSASA